jgi:hypothetical protein
MYQSEMGGIIGSSSAFCVLEMADTEVYPNSTVVCDNKGALQRCPADREWMKTTAKHFDLVSIVSATWETSLCNVKTTILNWTRTTFQNRKLRVRVIKSNAFVI